MPYYDYRCVFCEETHESFHSMTESKEDSTCPKCNKPQALKRKTPFDLVVKQESKAGEVVKETISTAKEEVKREKESLSRQEYKK